MHANNLWMTVTIPKGLTGRDFRQHCRDQGINLTSNNVRLLNSCLDELIVEKSRTVGLHRLKVADFLNGSPSADFIGSEEVMKHARKNGYKTCPFETALFVGVSVTFRRHVRLVFPISGVFLKDKAVSEVSIVKEGTGLLTINFFISAFPNVWQPISEFVLTR